MCAQVLDLHGEEGQGYREISPAEHVRQVLMTCGIKAMVVKMPASVPIQFVMSINVLSPFNNAPSAMVTQAPLAVAVVHAYGFRTGHRYRLEVLLTAGVSPAKGSDITLEPMCTVQAVSG